MNYETFESPLHEAVRRGLHRSAEKWIQIGVSLEAISSDGKTPLEIAINNRDLDMIAILIINGANMSHETTKGRPFHIAVSLEFWDAVNYFLNEGLNPNETNKAGNTAMHLMCTVKATEKCLKTCQFLLNRGASLTALNADGKTPLDLVIEEGNIDLVRVFVANGADIHRRAAHGKSLHLAVSSKHYDVVDYLIQKKVDVTGKNSRGETALHLICKSEINQISSDICRLLLRSGADVNAEDDEKKNSVFYILDKLENSLSHMSSHDELIKFENDFGKVTFVLDIISDHLNHGSDVNEVFGKCPNLLHIAVAVGHVELVENLLKRNVNVNIQTDEDAAPVHHAAFFGRRQFISALLRHGADIHATMRGKLTPLHIAVLKHHLEFALVLIRSGADINARDDQGRTILDIATAKEKSAILSTYSKV